MKEKRTSKRSTKKKSNQIKKEESIKSRITKQKQEMNKRKKFVFPESPKPIGAFFRSHSHSRSPIIEQLCELLEQEANRRLREECAAKHFTVDSIWRPCEQAIGPVAPKPVDLVVIIDTSGSMSDEANSLSDAADTAIQAAQKRCVADLRVAWFGLEGTFPGTKFDTKLRDYLHSLGVADVDIDHRLGSLGAEDGGAAIKDVCDHFDWRPDASRAIFFLGDEPLAGALPGNYWLDSEDIQAADDAIDAANNKSVKVYTYAGTGIENYFDPSTGVRAEEEYSRVATATGGLAYSAASGNISEFQQILEEIICSTSGGLCGAVRLPEIRPCLSLKWGDGESDRIETDDVEVLCLTATNPYTNVTFKNLTLFLLILGPEGSLPAALPDGTPSVIIKPYSMIFLGDIAPCAGNKAGESSAVSREVVLISRGAQEGTYYIFAAYCYSVEFKLAFASVFPVELVKS